MRIVIVSAFIVIVLCAYASAAPQFGWRPHRPNHRYNYLVEALLELANQAGRNNTNTNVVRLGNNTVIISGVANAESHVNSPPSWSNQGFGNGYGGSPPSGYWPPSGFWRASIDAEDKLNESLEKQQQEQIGIEDAPEQSNEFDDTNEPDEAKDSEHADQLEFDEESNESEGSEDSNESKEFNGSEGEADSNESDEAEDSEHADQFDYNEESNEHEDDGHPKSQNNEGSDQSAKNKQHDEKTI